VKGLGRSSRDPSPQMVRALRRRDLGCRFPGCGTRAFTKAHHIRWWARNGPTDMDNLVLLCSFHHTCVHELGWSLTLKPDNTVRFYRPDGREYRAGPGPPGHLAR
jgi:HNH endonuclease